MRRFVVVPLALCACSDFITLDDASTGNDVTQPTQDVLVLPLDATIFVDATVDADLLDGTTDGDAPLTCASLPDGTVCKAAPDLCHTDGVCKAGQCMAPQ